MPDQTEDTTRIDPTPRRQPPGRCPRNWLIPTNCPRL
jgi:hypothetical protein